MCGYFLKSPLKVLYINYSDFKATSPMINAKKLIAWILIRLCVCMWVCRTYEYEVGDICQYQDLVYPNFLILSFHVQATSATLS